MGSFRKGHLSKDVSAMANLLSFNGFKSIQSMMKAKISHLLPGRRTLKGLLFRCLVHQTYSLATMGPKVRSTASCSLTKMAKRTPKPCVSSGSSSSRHGVVQNCYRKLNRWSLNLHCVRIAQMTTTDRRKACATLPGKERAAKSRPNATQATQHISESATWAVKRKPRARTRTRPRRRPGKLSEFFTKMDASMTQVLPINA